MRLLVHAAIESTSSTTLACAFAWQALLNPIRIDRSDLTEKTKTKTKTNETPERGAGAAGGECVLSGRA